MQQQELIQLLDGYLAGQLSGGELRRLLSTVGDPSLEPYWMEWMDSVWENERLQQLSDEATGERILSYIISQEQDAIEPEEPLLIEEVPRIRPRRVNWFRYAAAAAILLMIGTGIYYFMQPDRKQTVPIAQVTKDILPGRNLAVLTLANGKVVVLDSTKGEIAKSGNLKVLNSDGKLDYEGKADAVELHTLTTPKGGQYQLTLPDGSQVWLNAASSISYPTAFVGKERKVTITGEAYFEVAKDQTKPFFVSVENKQTVKVLGTHFNVNAYENESSINTTLLEGTVRVVHYTHDDKPVTLKPGQQAQLSTEIKVLNDADIEKVMAWKNGHFNFDGLSLQEAMRQLERWYDIEVVYEKNVPDIKFFGELDRNLTLASLLDGLKFIGVHFKIEGRQLIVQP